MVVTALGIFNACEKSDGLIDESIDAQSQEAIKPDVYSENGYLVVKNYEAADSLRMMLQNQSLEEQSNWDNKMGLKSAKIFRAKASDKLAGYEDYDKAKKYAEELVEEGYFNMADSSLCYPFNNYTWDCILNKDGIIKIGDVLYCFQRDAQITIIDGKLKTLSQFLNNPGSCDSALVKIYPYQTLKSTIPTKYGTVKSETKKSAKKGVRWTLSLCYGKETMEIPLPVGNVTHQNGVKYYLYFHKQKKATFGWRDSKGIFLHQRVSYDLGGNSNSLVPGGYWEHRVNMTPETGYTPLNTSELSSVYLDLPPWIFNWPLPMDSRFHEGNAPVIKNFSCNGELDVHNLIINLTIN
ncbi:MAG: hypothetical protein ACK5HT_07000 [Draconibacterium sp.]